MPDASNGAESSPISELLRSPLDDMPPPSPILGKVVVALVAFGAIGVALWLSGGEGPVPAGTTVLPGTENSTPGTTAPDAGGTTVAPTTTQVVTVGEDPGLAYHFEMAGTPDGTLLFGGLVFADGESTPLEDTWLVDADSGVWTRLHSNGGPSPRSGHALVYHPPTNQVVMFGGGDPGWSGCRFIRRCPTGDQIDELWLFDVGSQTWRDVTPEPETDVLWPEPRFGASLVVDPVSGAVVMFGGGGTAMDNYGPEPFVYDDTWALDVESLEWSPLEPPESPPGRLFHSMVEMDGVLYMFGGDAVRDEDDRLWAFDPAAESWAPVPDGGEGPGTRWLFVFAADPSGQLVVAGGEGPRIRQISEGVTANEIAVLDETWSWSEAGGWVARDPLPEATFGAGGTLDPGLGQIVTFTGEQLLRYEAALGKWVGQLE